MKTTIVTIALLCSLCQHLTLTSASKINAFQPTRIIRDDKSKLVFSIDGFAKDAIATATCDNQDTGSSKCNVQLTSYNPYLQRSCQLILADATVHGTFPFDRLVPLGNDKAVFLWSTPSRELRLSIVHFNDCRTYEAEIKNTEEKAAEVFAEVVVANENGTFDVSIRDQKLCGNGRYCRVRFDAKAQRIGEPIPWMSKLPISMMFVHSIGNEGYFMNKINFENLSSMVYFIDLQGNERLMRSYPGNKGLYESSTWVATSSAHGLLTACPERLSTCEQFDLQNKTILASVNVLKSPTLATAVHNLPNGGFLRFSEPTSERKEYRVTKYDSTGKEVGTVDIEGIGFVGENRNPVPVVQMYEGKEGKYCVSIAAAIMNSEEEIGEVQFNVACFDDKDFS